MPILGNLIGGKLEPPTRPDLPQTGPGGCKSQLECEEFCSKTENKEECSKFSPPGDLKGKDEGQGSVSRNRGEQTGPGGCKSQNECDAYCDKPENREECSKFAPPERR